MKQSYREAQRQEIIKYTQATNYKFDNKTNTIFKIHFTSEESLEYPILLKIVKL